MATTIDIASMAKNREVRKINGQYVEVFPETKAQYVTVDDWQGSAAKLSDVLTSLTNVVHTSGNETINGEKTFTGFIYGSSSTFSIRNSTSGDTGSLGIYGASSYQNGSYIVLYGKNHDTYPGKIRFTAKDASNTKVFEASPDGSLTWDGKDIAIDDTVVHLTGDQTVNGVKTFGSGLVVSTTAGFKRNVDNSYVALYGCSGYGKGAYINLRGKDNSDAGWFTLRASNGTNNKDLVGKPDGTLTWAGKELVYTSGDQTIGGVKTFTDTIIAKSGISDIAIKASGNDGCVRIGGGSDGKVTTGAVLMACGINSGAGNAGRFKLIASDGTNNKYLTGDPSGTLTWNGQNIQTSSDERIKTPLSDIPDAILDAWGAVDWGQYKYLDAVAVKGESARLHLGLIAQRVKSAFEVRGLNACAYGILCHEEHPATEDEPAVDIWMVRYTEALAMEAAYQRRRADRAEARLTALEQRLDEMETVIATLGFSGGDQE